MKCPKCNSSTLVIDSRDIHDRIRRRRKCTECKYRFSTVEILYTPRKRLTKAQKLVRQINKELNK